MISTELTKERRRVLVTGGGGFIGANLVAALLAAGHEVHATLRPDGSRSRLPALASVRQHELDLRNEAAVRRLLLALRPELIFHAAFPSAYAGHSLNRVAHDAIRVVSLLLDSAAYIGSCRFVHLGSSLEYGPSQQAHHEEELLRPTTIRGAVKAAESQLVLQQARVGAVATTVLRIFSVYGPWEPEHRLVPTALLAAREGGELALTPAGYGHDLVFVRDVAAACLLAASEPRAVGEIFNVGGGQHVTNEDLVSAIETVAAEEGESGRIRIRVGAYEPREMDRKVWVADLSKSREILGWSPRRSLHDGLRETLRWMRARD